MAFIQLAATLLVMVLHSVSASFFMAGFAAMFALQIVMLVRMKKQVGKYCAMEF